MKKKDGNATGMAGEFFVMEQLFRLGHIPALTLGHTKMIDILVRTAKGQYAISVKSVQSGGKWPVGKRDYSQETDLFFVFLLYKYFDNVGTRPEAYLMRAVDVEHYKRSWFEQYAIYYSHYEFGIDMQPYKEQWKLLPAPAHDL